MSMDSQVRSWIEQAKSEVTKGSSASPQTLTTLIAAIAGHLSRADLSSGEKSELETLRSRFRRS